MPVFLGALYNAEHEEIIMIQQRVKGNSPLKCKRWRDGVCVRLRGSERESESERERERENKTITKSLSNNWTFEVYKHASHQPHLIDTAF